MTNTGEVTERDPGGNPEMAAALAQGDIPDSLTMDGLAEVYAAKRLRFVGYADRFLSAGYADGEDALHDVVLRAIERIGNSSRGPVAECPAGYVQRRLRSHLLGIGIRSSVPVSMECIAEALPIDGMREFTDFNSLGDISELRNLMEILKKELSKAHLETLLCTALGGLTCEEVAERQHIGLVAAKSRLFSARKAAKKVLAAYQYER